MVAPIDVSKAILMRGVDLTHSLNYFLIKKINNLGEKGLYFVVISVGSVDVPSSKSLIFLIDLQIGTVQESLIGTAV